VHWLLYPWGKKPGIHWIGGWLVPRAALDVETIQNGLLECMHHLYMDESKAEIEKEIFIALQTDEATDVLCQSHFLFICSVQ
jgi:hypothetical protein